MRKIAVDLDPDCESLTRELGITDDEIYLTVNDDVENVAVATDDFSRYIAFREFLGGRIIMVECLVTELDPGKYDPKNGVSRTLS